MAKAGTAYFSVEGREKCLEGVTDQLDCDVAVNNLADLARKLEEALKSVLGSG
jgi:hypothetical protein